MCPGVVLNDIVGDDIHAECAGDHRYLATDATTTKNAQGFALP